MKISKVFLLMLDSFRNILPCINGSKLMLICNFLIKEFDEIHSLLNKNSKQSVNMDWDHW